jgi:hypothetical protein
MLSVLNAVFQKKINIEAFVYEFEIYHLIWFLHDRIKEYRKYLNQNQSPNVFRKLQNTTSV